MVCFQWLKQIFIRPIIEKAACQFKLSAGATREPSTLLHIHIASPSHFPLHIHHDVYYVETDPSITETVARPFLLDLATWPNESH